MIPTGWKRLLIVITAFWVTIVAGYTLYEKSEINFFDRFDKPTPSYLCWKWASIETTPKKGDSVNEKQSGLPDYVKKAIREKSKMDSDALAKKYGGTPANESNRQRSTSFDLSTARPVYPNIDGVSVKEGWKLVPKWKNILLVTGLPVLFLWGVFFSAFWVLAGFKKCKSS